MQVSNQWDRDFNTVKMNESFWTLRQFWNPIVYMYMITRGMMVKNGYFYRKAYHG